MSADVTVATNATKQPVSTNDHVKVFVTLPVHSVFNSWEDTLASSIQAELGADAGGIFQVTDSPGAADLVVLMESNTAKDHRHSANLEREPLLNDFCEKVVTVNYEDSPAGFLRGAYSSLEAAQFDPAIHRSWPSMFLPNSEVYDVTTEEIESHRPRFLFSFAGSVSHPIRRLLFKLFKGETRSHRVLEVDRWYDHTLDERKTYVTDILDSTFVLCPRGHASYSHRIPEVMALGRVPVIIADGWVPFSIPEDDYYIHVPEAELVRIPEILEARRMEGERMGARAREVWEKYFSRQSRAGAVMEVLRQLVTTGSEPMTIEHYRSRWSSRSFKRVNGWTPLGLLSGWMRRKLKRFRKISG